MRITINQNDFEAMDDTSLIWACIEPAMKQARGKNFAVKTEVYSGLNEGQQALFMFQMLYGHTVSGIEEFYSHLSYLLANEGVWGQLRKGLQYFGDSDMLRILEKMEQLFQSMKTDELKENPEEAEIKPKTEVSMRLLNQLFRETLPSTIKKVAGYIRGNTVEFVQFMD